MPTYTDPVILDSTGQDIVTGLASIAAALPGGSSKADKTDLASIQATGTTNTTGATITAGTYFYLNGALVHAKLDIASGGLFTIGTNYSVVTAGALNELKSAFTLYLPITNTAGFHNSIYRGKYLGTSVTAAQYAAISAGTFDDLYIGDYWTIGGVNWRIADIDYWFGKGDTACNTHHLVIVPDTCLYDAKMNDSNVTTGGYVGSKMYTDNLATAKTTIQNAFGAANLLTKREYFVNAVTNGKPSGGAWTDSVVDLMNEINVYGCPVFTPTSDGSTVPSLYTIDYPQFSLFRLDPTRICNRVNWWLRDVVTAANFAAVTYGGTADYFLASTSRGVRPAFAIKA